MANRWLRRLMATISECWEYHTLSLHIGFRYCKPKGQDDGWEIWAYPVVQEILGGKHDGETAWSGFHFDVSRLLENMEAEEIGVSTAMRQQSPELVLEGRFRGKAVLVHVCLEPPEGVEATEIIDLTGRGVPIIREKA